MTLTTEVRINWPVPAVKLLDHVTRAAGGNPATVRRTETRPGEPYFPGSTFTHTFHRVANNPGQGLRTLAEIEWSERPDVGDDEWPEPPALVMLSIDNPYGGLKGPSGREVQATEILPTVRDWLDEQGVPRDAWWWQDETAGTYHPGTEDVGKLNTDEPRVTWQPEAAA